MNVLKTKISVLALILWTALLSCSKDDNNLPLVQDPQQIENSITTDTWRITKFIDSGDNETGNFSGYAFTFDGTGTLVATNGASNYIGTWSITDSNSNDDSPDDLDFNISFAVTDNFEDLNDDWSFISSTSTRIELIDVSGGNGGTDYLTFEKN